jgi:hypothetical protein
MGFRLFRIGNKSVGELKALSFRRSLRNSTIIIYVIALWVAYIVVRYMGYDVSRWGGVVFSLLNVAFISAIDKQLPTRRFRSLGILLGLMGDMFVFFGVLKYLKGTLSMDVEVWLFGILILVAYGYSAYSLWRWMRNIRWYKDLVQQRELRAKRKRNLAY